MYSTGLKFTITFLNTPSPFYQVFYKKDCVTVEKRKTTKKKHFRGKVTTTASAAQMLLTVWLIRFSATNKTFVDRCAMIGKFDNSITLILSCVSVFFFLRRDSSHGAELSFQHYWSHQLTTKECYVDTTNIHWQCCCSERTVQSRAWIHHGYVYVTNSAIHVFWCSGKRCLLHVWHHLGRYSTYFSAIKFEIVSFFIFIIII